MQQRKVKIIISGGGTGGHIFPAISIARALERKLSDVEILFVGARGKMEMEKVPQAGYPIKGLWISGFRRDLTLKNLSFPFKVLHSLYRARKIIREFKPNVVVGVGGYASGPTLYAASGMKITTVIQEQNAYPGITNRLLADRVDRICAGAPGLDRFFPAGKIVFTGNPVRQDVIRIAGLREEGLRRFGLSTDKTTLLVTGGSQGARMLNHAVAAVLPFLKYKDVQLIWQTGPLFINRAEELVNETDRDLFKPVSFITEMQYGYASADIILSRAGAITIAEISAAAKPVIFVPLPTAAENHQLKNAQALEKQDAAIVVEEKDVMSRLQKILEEVIESKETRKRLSNNIAKMAVKDADQRIADEIINLIK